MTTVGRWSPNKVRARVLDGTWVSTEELGGMVLVTPTSIAYSGTSASIGTNGSVEFTACSSLSLNSVFSADYDNYMVTMRATSSGAVVLHGIRLRASGTDEASASNYYTYQNLLAYGTTISAGRASTSIGYIQNAYNTQITGVSTYMYGPFLSQPTAVRTVTVSDLSSATIVDRAWTHSLSNSYDGITIIPDTGTITGLVSVYGLVGA